MVISFFVRCAVQLKRITLNILVAVPVLFLSMLVITPVQAVNLTQAQIWKAPDYTRLVFDLSASFQHKLFLLSNPERLVVDINQTRLKTSLSRLKMMNRKLSSSPIKRIRWARKKNNSLRIVFDLKRPVNPKSLFLPPNNKHGNRLVLNLYEMKSVKDPDVVIKTMNTDKSRKRNLIVAIDPGHGGIDPGASGPGNVKEKNVVLSIGRDLKRMLNKRRGITAKLTRKGDYYISLRERIRLARKYGADLMISIHADSSDSRHAQGASIYALSRRGATSEAARWVARKENDADLIGGDGSLSLSDKSNMLAGVLLDLSQTASLKSSLRLGSKILQFLGRLTKLHKHRVEQAGFVVLKSPDIPSILIETGFISNLKESRRLTSKKYQRKLALAIDRGVLSYFNTYPVEGTFLAWQKEQKLKSKRAGSRLIALVKAKSSIKNKLARTE